MDDKSLPEVIQGVQALLRAIDAGIMSCSPAYRNRLEGAVVALEALNASPSNDRLVDGAADPVSESDEQR